jgi:hypothetical protein
MAAHRARPQLELASGTGIVTHGGSASRANRLCKWRRILKNQLTISELVASEQQS